MPRRDEPLEGSASFFQEKVIEWRELNAAHDWLECYKEIQPLCSTMPLLVHHQNEILDALLGRLTMQCKLSLEPILDLIATLSRDLASDFLGHLEKVFTTIVDVVVAQGGDSDAQVLKYVYTAMSSMCKNLAKYLVLDLKPVLKLTSDLRHHASQHVRKFTAEALGFLIRRAKDEQAEDAIQYLYAEALEENHGCDGNGEMMASSMKGVGNGLHSRCGRILQMLFDDDLISSDECIARAAVYSIRQSCLVSCFEHVRESERLSPIWNLLIQYCKVLSSDLRQNHGADALLENARMMKLMSILVRHRGGSRVIDHINAIFSLLDVLMDPKISLNEHEMQIEDSLVSEYTCPDFERNVLNFVATFLRIVSKHTSKGLDQHVASWEPMLEKIDIDKYLDFVITLCHYPRHFSVQRDSYKSQSSIAMLFIPMAIDKIMTSNRNDQSLWNYLVSLGDYIWDLKLTANCAMHMEKLQELIEEAIQNNDMHIIWAAARTIKLLCNSMSVQDDLYSKALSATTSLQDSLPEDDYLALVSSVYVSKACAISNSLQYGPVDGIDEFASLVQGALRENPTNYFCIKAASTLFTNIPSQATLKSDDLRKLAENLSSPCRNLRRHSLELIVASGSLQGENPLTYLLELENHPLGADSGRHALVTLGRVQNMIEYRKFAEDLIEPTVRGLLGLLHVKLSSYWAPAAKALAASANAFPDIAWPIILEGVINTQSELYKHGMNTATVAHEERDTLFTLQSKFDSYMREATAEEYSDAAARLSHQLKCMSEIDTSILLKKSKEWVPVFLAFANDVDLQVEDDDNDDAIERSRRHIPPRVWRSLLRDWLKVLMSFKSLNQLVDSKSVLESVSSHLMDLDPLVQKTVFNVLKLFKLKWLNPYLERILRLIDNKTLRSELTAFPLAPVATSTRNEDSVLQIEKEHRKNLVPFIIASLFPRMRKRNGRLAGKGML